MIVAAAVCPGPPLLVPGLAPRLRGAVPDLVAASQAAVASLVAPERIAAGRITAEGVAAERIAPGRIVVVTTGVPGVGAVARGPGSLISSSPLARSDLRLSGSTAVLPAGIVGVPAEWWSASWGEAGPPGAPAVGTIVAAHLLARGGVTVPTTAVEVDPAAPDPAEQVRDLVPGIEDTVPTGLLLIADGAAAHGGDAPAAEDPDAAEFDGALLTVLDDADPSALARFCRARAGQATALRCESLAAWGALAGLTIDRAPTGGRVAYYGAPFGVGYLVAEWQWPSTD